MEYPIAERHPNNIIFGKENAKNKGNPKFLMDPIIKKDYYYWLRDDQRKDKKVLKYLNEENNYAENILSKKGVFIEKNKILSELRKNMVEDYDTIHLPHGKSGFDSPYRFYKVFEKNKSYPIFYYEINNKKIKYLDPNDFKQKSLNDVSEPVFSPSLNIYGFGMDYNGSELYEIKLFKFPSLEKIEHNIPNVLYSTFLLSDSDVFYILADKNNNPNRLYKYNIESKETVLIYEVLDIEEQISMDICNDYESIIYSVENYNDNEVRIFWFDGKRKGTNLLIKKMRKNVEYSVDIFDDYFIIKTNENKCKNYTIKYCKIGKKKWMNLIDYDEKIYIEEVNVVKNGIILSCRSEGEQYFKFLHLNNMKIIDENIIKKGNGGYYQDISYVSYNNNTIIYNYQNFLTPLTYYSLDLETLEEKEIKKKVVKNYDQSKYKTERIYIKNRKNKIAIDILSLKDFKKGKCLLYGYGSYGMNVEIKFDDKLFSLVDRGVAYVITNPRGSCYMGKTYYEDGRMLKKMNTFKDFIKVSEYLLKSGICEKNQLSIEGRSAGGLLVGACSILRPDLYKNVLAIVPFVDVLTTMSDSTIPLTTNEWTQWGNPNIKKYYDYMKKYSPIDNIKEGVCYPNYYVQAGLNDPRVAYWEPAKFVATLRYNSDCENTIILKTEMEKGHFGSWDRYKFLEETAERFAFILKN